MEKLALNFLLLWMGSLMFGDAIAQPQIRNEDHFYRRRVVNRIDLAEKINRPLVQRQSGIYGSNQQASNQGLIHALLTGLKEGRYIAYEPDNLGKPMDYNSVLARMEEFDFTDIDMEEEYEEEDDEVPDASEFIIAEDLLSEEDDLGLMTDKENTEADPLDDISAYETVVQFVEDRIFDKNRGEMTYKIDHIQVIWSDPGETLPEKYLASFRYEDVKDALEQVEWVNRFNDAERRSLKEIFELRLFHSYIINVSGNGVLSLDEAERRRQALIEFEHHLWHL